MPNGAASEDARSSKIGSAEYGPKSAMRRDFSIQGFQITVVRLPCFATRIKTGGLLPVLQ